MNEDALAQLRCEKRLKIAAWAPHLDDIISTGGTVAESVEALLAAGAQEASRSRPRTAYCSMRRATS